VKGHVAPLLALTALLPLAPASAQDAQLFVKEEALNRVVERLRDRSDSGVYQPTVPVTTPGLYYNCQFAGVFECLGPPSSPQDPLASVPLQRCQKKGGGTSLVPGGEPVGWQWWITGSRFEAKEGSLAFTAKVRSRIGTRWSAVERTVPATVAFDSGANLLRIRVDEYKVPLTYEADGLTQTIAEVDVGRLSSFAIRVPPQTAQVPLPNGTTRTLTLRALSATPVYQAGRVGLRVDVGSGAGNLPSPGGWTVGAPAAEDGLLGINESVLNEMTAALGPLPFQGSFNVPVPIPNPFFPLGPPFFIVNIPCGAVAVVTGLRFDIDAAPAPIRVTGQVNGTVCNLPIIGGTVSSTATVVHNASSRTLRISTAPTTWRPSVGPFTVPFTVNVGPSLSVPAIPFRSTVLELETTAGPMAFNLSSEDIALTRRNGFIEVRGNVVLR